MKINYPNAFDQKMGERDGRTNLGSNIFIHGKSATIGCIPIGDEGIEEVFLLVESAIDLGVEVLIFPHDFRLDPIPPTLNHITWESELYTTLLKQVPSLP